MGEPSLHKEGSPDLTVLNAHSYERRRHEAPVIGCTYGEVRRGDESPLRRMAQRGALATHLRGEATECWPKPRTFMIRCAPKTGAWDLV